ncbi:unnamed protein product [Prunus armeniaca]|uniref:Uncharacterized protein n=1 Tax=Prunus armeniaca TaxID=36596 RepID=A0A6J5WL17_PRUAR|nr:unnamed protein product [Prunus armeniaca]CAB4301091.1 unnamed protein product [Prunus armeniaca]
MENYNVLATMAGNSSDCTNILSSADNVIGRACGGVVNNGIHCAPELARSYIDHWFEKCGRLLGVSTPYVFEGCLIMAGWDVKDVAYVYDVQRSEVSYITRPKEYGGFVNESGRETVLEYFRTCKKVVQSSSELLKHVIRALICATLFDQNSGGYLCVFEVKKKDVKVVYHQTVLRALSEYYNDMVAITMAEAVGKPEMTVADEANNPS